MSMLPDAITLSIEQAEQCPFRGPVKGEPFMGRVEGDAVLLIVFSPNVTF